MHDRIRELLDEITVCEDELRTAVSEQQSTLFFQTKGKRVEFEDSIKRAHKKLKTSFFR